MTVFERLSLLGWHWIGRPAQGGGALYVKRGWTCWVPPWDYRSTFGTMQGVKFTKEATQ